MSPAYEYRAARALEMLKRITQDDDLVSERSRKLYNECHRLLREHDDDVEQALDTYYQQQRKGE